MIQRKELNSVAVKIYSDCGKRVKKVGTNEVLPVAYEMINGNHHIYEEVE